MSRKVPSHPSIPHPIISNPTHCDPGQALKLSEPQFLALKNVGNMTFLVTNQGQVRKGPSASTIFYPHPSCAPRI